MSELLQFILSTGEQFRRARLPSLYSDFSLQRSSNPDGYAANVSAWENALRKAAQAGLIPAPGNSHETLSLRTGEELLQALTTKEWGRPLSLGTVIDEAVKNKHMIPLQEFLDAPTSIYNRKWAIRPWWLISWTLRQLGLFERHAALERLPTAQYTIVPNVEEAAGQVMSLMANRTNLVDRIHPKEVFVKEASKIIGLHSDLTDCDQNVLLKFLARDKEALVYNDIAVKFKSRNEPLSPISTQDRTIASLKTLIADLNLQTAALNVRVTDLTEKAQSAVKAKNRVAALAALKSKKGAETALSQRYETLEQVEGVYGKIEQAVDQVALVRVMEASTGVLRNLHTQLGGIERVEDIVEGLRDEMGKVDEINQVMENASRGEAAVDEGEIDDELEALEQQDRAEREEKEAEQTRRRLAELDQVERRIPSHGLDKQQPEDAGIAADANASHESFSQNNPSKEQSQSVKDTAEAVAADS